MAIELLQVNYDDGEQELVWVAAERVRLLTHPREVFCLPPSSQDLQKLSKQLLEGADAENGESS